MKKPGKTISEIARKATYFEKKTIERLKETCTEDPYLAETLMKGLKK